jgi:hypothetical protein
MFPHQSGLISVVLVEDMELAEKVPDPMLGPTTPRLADVPVTVLDGDAPLATIALLATTKPLVLLT